MVSVERAAEDISRFISEQAAALGKPGAVVALRGDAASAVCVHLAARALGPPAVLALSMPEMRVTDPGELNDSMELAERARVEHRVVEVSPVMKAWALSIPDFDPGAAGLSEGLRFRVRMSLAHYYGGRMGRMVVGVEDRTRLLVYSDADTGSDIYPLGNLLRGEVDALARLLRVPEEIVRKPAPPADGLGMRGDEMERAMHALVVEGLDPEGAERRSGVPLERIRGLQRRIQSHRRRADGLRIPPL